MTSSGLRSRCHRALRIVLASVVVCASAAAQSADLNRGTSVHPEREAYYGDLHLHTSYSLDAYFFYGPQVDPDGAYRFARGESGRYLDQEVRRTTARLDFMAVTDHAEWIGIANSIEEPDSPLSRSELGEPLRKRQPKAFYQKLGDWPSTVNSVPGVDADAITHSIWQRTIDAANRYYRPGQFTTFIGYEWTSTPGGLHLHRNVIFRGDKAPDPFTAFDSKRPEDLWHFLEEIRKQGYEAIAIPHSSNWSGGLMFDWIDSDGKPIDQEYAERRASHEPLVEIVQNKGQSETSPMLAPSDEFSNFEVIEGLKRFADDKHTSTTSGSYVRDALGRGLTLAQNTGGANPYKYGFVGGSDFHNGLSESAENAYGGLLGAADLERKVPDLDTWAERLVEASWNSPSELRSNDGRETATVAAERELWKSDLYKFGSSGLTGVWAEQNTREAIYAALRRKETFATSGTRLKFRFFGGWVFTERLLKQKNWVRTAYRHGVPMGGDLPPRPAGKQAPAFAVWAVKDPNGANLDRLQVVKVWLENGKHMDKVYNVALSSGRQVSSKTGRAEPVGNTVDLQRATYTNTIGATQLSAVWRDPHFDPRVPAVYYLRVIEIPTPRWSSIVAVKRGQPLPADVPATLQERGWSSPIWFTPELAARGIGD